MSNREIPTRNAATSLQRLYGKVAIVTGAATGNGQAIAQAFAREGASVLVADIAPDGAPETLNIIESAGGIAKALQADVRKADDAARMVEAALSWFGRLDIMVNNAGVIGRGDFLEVAEHEWDRIMDINFKGTFLCSQAAARHMVKQGSGNIINIASIAAESMDPVIVPYCASKGGVRALTKAMALALAKRGVRVNAIGPGPVYTNLNRDKLDNPETMAAVVAHIPMGRVGQPLDLTGAAVFLACDESAYVTGITLYVDGGYLTM
ncbi:MAG: SDR family NAD(P)-dependent oxidoreductase [Vulcanimicrobiaceae bacterium]